VELPMKIPSLILLRLALCLIGAPAFAAERKPNVIVVLADDMGWSDLSCFGGKEVKTENIDRLASEGIKFQHFYVNSPICSPSRVAITTGQYPQRWRISSYLDNRKMNQNRGLRNGSIPQPLLLPDNSNKTATPPATLANGTWAGNVMWPMPQRRRIMALTKAW
jgi:uncharacterized sulfatase